MPLAVEGTKKHSKKKINLKKYKRYAFIKEHLGPAVMYVPHECLTNDLMWSILNDFV